LDRSPDTYENVKNCLVGAGAGDLLLEDEGREDGVGGGQRTILVQSNCKRNKKVLIIINVSKSSYFPYINARNGEYFMKLNII
jgi:hypothetical protein